MRRLMMRVVLLAIAALLCALPQMLIAGDTPNSQPQLSQRPQYRLRPNDLIDVNFELVSEYNQTVRVGPDGYISLKGIQPVDVQGQTLSQAADLIKKAYSGMLRNPIVAIALREYEKPYFLVTGEVQHPGKFDLLSSTTATEAVAMAGGFTHDAKHSQVVVFREVPNGWVYVKQLNVKEMLKKGDLAEDLRLQPGDLIFVPKNTISKIDRYIPNFGVGYHF